MTGANSVASFQKRHSRRSFDNCGSAPTSRDLSNRKVPQEWRGGHACCAELGITGTTITFAICLHGDLSTRGPHLGLGPSVDGGFRMFYIFFTFIFELKGAAEMSDDEREMGSQKAAAMAVGKEAQQRRQSRKLRRVQQRSPAEQQQLRGATAPTGGSATAPVSTSISAR